jgi:hypothetical protein
MVDMILLASGGFFVGLAVGVVLCIWVLSETDPLK